FEATRTKYIGNTIVLRRAERLLLVLRDHYLGRLNDGGDVIAFLELHFLCALFRDNRLDQILPDAYHNVRHDIPNHNLSDFTFQLISHTNAHKSSSGFHFFSMLTSSIVSIRTDRAPTLSFGRTNRNGPVPSGSGFPFSLSATRT